MSDIDVGVESIVAVLAAAMGAGDASFMVDDDASASLFPGSSFQVRIDNELISVGSRSGRLFSSLSRGQERTAAHTHPADAAVEYVVGGGRLAEGGGGSQAGATRVLDLGILLATTTNDGPATIYTPSNGDFLVLMYSPVGYVAHDVDGGNGDIGIGLAPDFIAESGVLLPWTVETALQVSDQWFNGGYVGSTNVTSSIASAWMDGTPISAVATTGNSDLIDKPVGSWAALTGYTAGDLIFGGDGQWYKAQATGATGAVEPIWPGSGNSVADGTVGWDGIGIPATVGAIHLYALTATPAAP